MTDDYGERALAALFHRIAEVEAAEEHGDEQISWRATREALNWLHAIEEHIAGPEGSPQRPAYFRRRDTNSAGRVLGALVWVRGLTHHQQVVVRNADWRTSHITVAVEGGTAEEQSADPIVQLISSEVVEWRIISWSPRETLPAVADKYERDRWYEEAVANRPLV